MWINLQLGILIGLAILLLINVNDLSKKAGQLEKRQQALEKRADALGLKI